MFRHHDKQQQDGQPDTQPTNRDFARFGKKGVALGMVRQADPSTADPTQTRVTIVVDFKGGETAQFNEELASLYQPDAGSPEAKRLEDMRTAARFKHASKIPKITLHLEPGEMLPVQWNPDDPKKLGIDHAALRTMAVDEYIREQQPRPPEPGTAPTGPPWDVPEKCPTCGARVDQAKASNDPDPHCAFCEQPIPVTPRAKR